MSRVRFASARALFETFPKAYDHIATEPDDQPPLDFLNSLAGRGKFEEALAFCAYLLPRREAVWWACGSVRVLAGDLAGRPVEGLLRAEAWAREPDEERRLAAYEFAIEGDSDDPMMWLALATAWTGGSLSPAAPRAAPVPQHLTAVAVRVALLLLLRHLDGTQRTTRGRACVESGAQLAQSGL
jgi:hypothetical protein